MARTQRSGSGSTVAKRRDEKGQREERARVRRDTDVAVRDMLNLSDAVRDWYSAHMRPWHSQIHNAAVLARELAVGLRSGVVPPPPWPDDVLDHAGPRDREVQQLLDLLDRTAALADETREQLRPLLEWAKVTVPGRSRPSEAVQAALVEALQVEDDVLTASAEIREIDVATGKITTRPATVDVSTRARRSIQEIQDRIDDATNNVREPGALAKLVGTRRRKAKKDHGD